MSKKTLVINTREGLEEVLKIIAEESVYRARDELSIASEDERMRQADMASDLDQLRKHQKPEETEVTGEDDEDLFDDDPGAESGGEDDMAAQKAAKKQKTEKITFTMIKDKVNTIRSGRSLRDEEIRGELKSYFQDLDAGEKSALYAFLDGIAQVLTAGIEGDQADEPSDPPHNVTMHSDEEEEQHGERRPRKVKQSKPKPKAKPKAKMQKQRGLEDTSPPVAVGKKQRTEAIRRHIRDLMG